MRLVTRLIAITRAVQLRRQFREIDKALEQLAPNARKQLAGIAMREFSCAAKSEFPHLYGTSPDDKYRTWGSGTDVGLERLRSESLQVRLRGAALWLTVAFHETKDSPYPEQQELHRHLMRTLRVLRESVPPAEMSQWFSNQEVQAA